MHGIKIPQQDFALKMQGGAYARGGAYLWDTTVVENSDKSKQVYVHVSIRLELE